MVGERGKWASAAPAVPPELLARLRLDVLEMVFTARSGHVDSSFSAIEILAALYFRVLRIDPDEPDWPQRDRLILSKGHAAPALYACLARRGYFPSAELARLRRLGSHLQGHPRPGTPGVDAPTGSLGQGLSIAVGLAFAAARVRRESWRAFAIVSDGELNEGQTWEALLLAAHLRLANLRLVIDVNGLQFSGRTREVLDVGDVPGALGAIGWSCESVDGHSVDELSAALAAGDARPRAVLAQTTKGKGVSFIEDDLAWHGRVPTEDEYRRARAELERAL